MIEITPNINHATQGCFILGTVSEPEKGTEQRIPNSLHIDDYLQCGYRGIIEPDPTRGVPHSEVRIGDNMVFIISYMNRMKKYAFFKAVPVCSPDQSRHFNFGSNLLEDIPLKEGLTYQVQVLSWKTKEPYAGHPMFRLPGIDDVYGVLCHDKNHRVLVGDVYDAMLERIEDDYYCGRRRKVMVCNIVPEIKDGDQINIALASLGDNSVNRANKINADVPGYDFLVHVPVNTRMSRDGFCNVRVFKISGNRNPPKNGLPDEYRNLLPAKQRVDAIIIE